MYNVDTDISIIYNENGLRVQKTVNGTVTKYTLHGKNVVHMTQGSNELHFFYDAQNKPAVVVYNGTPYSYVKNLQGDIVAILNSAGTAVVNYVYDAWGKPISKSGSMASTLGTVQPFRYRGYVYDEETGLYYLRSRYYRPIWSRFTNADQVYISNLYVYCNNKPLLYSDHSGLAPQTSSEFMYTAINDASASALNPIEKWKQHGVEYISNGSGKGGRIKNSYLITAVDDMREYAEYLLTQSPYQDDYLGTVDAFVYEWDIHNCLYSVGDILGKERWMEMGQHFDFGATLFDDSHGVLSVVMWLMYESAYKDDYDKNILIHFGID